MTTDAASTPDAPARTRFRVTVRRRGGAAGSPVVDVQLLALDSGRVVWARTFSDADEAEALAAQVRDDLAHLAVEAFRARHGVPGDA